MNFALRHILRILGCVLLAAAASAAESSPTQAEARPQFPWTVDEALSEEGAFGFNISPDGHWVCWEQSGNLFVSSLTDQQEIQRTKQGEGCQSPKWSPDGRWIAFLSSRPNPKAPAGQKALAQLWLIPPFEGEPVPVTAGDQAVARFDWSGTNSLIFSRSEASALKEPPNKDTADNSIVVGDVSHDLPVRLFRVELNSGQVTRLTENRDRIELFWVSPNGRYVVTIHLASLSCYYDGLPRPVNFLTDLATGQQKQLFAGPRYGVFSVSWEPDSSGFYAASYHTTRDRYPAPSTTVLYHYALTNGAIEPIDLGWDKGISQDHYRASEVSKIGVVDQGFLTLLADGVRPKLARFSRVGRRWQRQWVTGVHAAHVFDFAMGRDGKTCVYQYSDASHPGQWYRALLEAAQLASPTQLTRLNPQFPSKPMAPCEVVHWRGALGETVEGTLFYPLDYRPGKKYPLVVELHGGPKELLMDKWYGFLLNQNLLAERGFFVFRPNYHGSSNYGLKWADAIVGRLNQLEVEDIETGVDYLIHRGLVEPERLAVIGGSQGGSLVASVTAATKRYQAAISADGVVEWADYWARSDMGGWMCASYFGKTPVQDPALYVRQSSFYQLAKVTTPTLILFGMEDKRCPVEQGWMYYRALQQTGKAEVRFVLFPGEGHAPLYHAKRALEEQLAWLEGHLFRKP